MANAAKPRRPKAPTIQKIEGLGIDAICERIEDGESLADIAKGLGVPKRTLSNWVASDDARSARAREARIASADACDDAAMAALRDPTLEPQRAREIAQHYRWRAKTRDPRGYGDRMAVDTTVDVRTMDTDALLAEIRAIAESAGALIVDGKG